MILYDFMKEGVPSYERLLPRKICVMWAVVYLAPPVKVSAFHLGQYNPRPLSICKTHNHHHHHHHQHTSPVSDCSLALWLGAGMLVRAAILRRCREGKRDAEQLVSHSEPADKIRDPPGLVGLLSDSLDHQLRPTHLRE